MTEAHFRDLLVTQVVGPTWTKIESPTTAGGIPDLYGIDRGRSLWIECKIIKKTLLPAQVNAQLSCGLAPRQLTGRQRRWHLAHQQAGGHSLILATVRSADLRWDQFPVWIWSGAAADTLFRTGHMPDDDRFSLFLFPRDTSWEPMRALFVPGAWI